MHYLRLKVVLLRILFYPRHYCRRTSSLLRRLFVVLLRILFFYTRLTIVVCAGDLLNPYIIYLRLKVALINPCNYLRLISSLLRRPFESMHYLRLKIALLRMLVYPRNYLRLISSLLRRRFVSMHYKRLTSNLLGTLF